MKNRIIFITTAFLFISFNLFAQKGFKKEGFDPNKSGNMGSKNSNLNEGESQLIQTIKANYKDYKIILHNGDTTIVDTTLTINHEYRFNFTGKDQFGNMEFANQGQTYTPLTANFNTLSLTPRNGTRSKDYSYKDAEDIKYYYVPTPTSEATYRTGIKQGQFLNFLASSNFSDRLNVSFEYKGLRSLGLYRNSLSSQKNLTTTASYSTKNKRYYLRWHYAQHILYNQENGGLTEESITKYEEKDSRTQDRGRLDVNLDDAYSTLDGKRIYLDQAYKFVESKPDSVKTKLSNIQLRHQLNYEWKKYSFDQENINSTNIFGPAYDSEIHDRAWNKQLENKISLVFNSPFVLGNFDVHARLINFNYYFDRLTIQSDNTLIPQSITGDAYGLGADWDAKIGKFNLEANLEGILGGSIDGNRIVVKAFIGEDISKAVGASLNIQSRTPDFNFQINQSSLQNFNWYNSNLKTENHRGLEVFANGVWGNLNGSYQQIDNYTYFLNNAAPEVKQLSGESVNYFKITWQKELKFGKFALNNNMIFQETIQGQDVYRLPSFVTRNTLYYSSNVFKGAPLFLQTGIHFNYFTSHFANMYNPVLGSYVVQEADNPTAIGNFPVFDFFINARVRRTRMFLKVDNFTSSFMKQNYYSSVAYPYRDWRIRFGLIWTWFN